MKKICLLGGTGFVGQHLTASLVTHGYQARLLSRHPQRHREPRVLPGVEVLKADVHQAEQLQKHFQGCDAVINLVGILNESGNDGGGFRVVHRDLPEKVVNACQAAGIKRLLHMSALNAGKGRSHYLRSKGEGESLVRETGNLEVTVFRPSVIFGKGDSFFNQFAGLLKMSPCCFPLACGGSRFAPVWVGDVTQAFIRALEDPETIGQAYDLCGPRVYSLTELVSYTAEQIGVKRKIIPLGDKLSRLQARVFDHIPGKPFSTDNYLSLQTDSVCGHNGCADLDISPQSVEAIVPGYLAGRSPRGNYQGFRNLARR